MRGGRRKRRREQGERGKRMLRIKMEGQTGKIVHSLVGCLADVHVVWLPMRLHP